jgi:hypothetical protein
MDLQRKVSTSSPITFPKHTSNLFQRISWHFKWHRVNEIDLNPKIWYFSHLCLNFFKCSH